MDRNFDWAQNYPCKIGRILNISSPNDRAVKWMPSWKWLRRCVMRDKDGIFGRIGREGIDFSGMPRDFLNSNEGVAGRDFLNNGLSGN